MIDLITVVFRDEISLLQIQARSIEKYIDEVDTITVIVNDSADVLELIDTNWWGKYQDRVKVKVRTFEPRVNGWESQQLCKLLAAADSQSEWSMVLDAKTWFVQTLDYNKLFDSDGRANVGLCGIFLPFLDSQKFVEKYFNISMPMVIGPQGVPFMFHTNTAKELVNSVDDFVDFFQTALRYPNLVTEFHLYSGYVIANGKLGNLYNKTPYYGLVNISQFEIDQFDNLFAQMNNSKILTASIHRGVYQLLTQERLNYWLDFLIAKGLIQTREEFELN
jgi:hypothetical protein